MADAAADDVKGLDISDTISFAPNHVRFVVPEGAADNSAHPIDLEDGRQISYTLPKGSKAGEEHMVRVDSSVNKKSVTITKEAKESKLGITLTNQGGERHPVITQMSETGAAAGILMVGDTLLTVSEGTMVTVECTDHESTSRLLRSARGTLKIEIMRPQVDVPTRIFHSGFLHKRSPKTLLGKSVWQRRWFELTAQELMYWELHVHSSGPKSQSFLGSQRGSILLAEVAGVRTDATGASPRKLDLLMKNKRMFELAAANADDAAAFAGAIRDALLGVLSVQPPPAAPLSLPEDEGPVDEADAAQPDEPLPAAEIVPVIKEVRFKAESVSY